VEYARAEAIKSLFGMKCFNEAFATWGPEIKSIIRPNPDFYSLLGLGDSLGKIFKTTGTSGRGQGTLSAGGSCWEGLVCWYLNLCLMGSRTVVIKHSKKLIPPCIADAITVNYGSFVSNTESDLVAISFPNLNDYFQPIENFSCNGKFQYVDTINRLCTRDFDKLEVGIVQCKTNWNDNAQIPMLWEIVYSSTGFSNRNISIGRNGFCMKDFKKFFYSFVTVPSNSLNYTTANLPVKRVYNLTGGNYWGRPTSSGVAQSIKEIFNRNFGTSWVNGSQKKDVESQLANKADLMYFNLTF